MFWVWLPFVVMIPQVCVHGFDSGVAEHSTWCELS